MIALWAKLKGYAIAAGALVVAAFVAYWRIREDGKNAVRAEQDAARIKALKQRKETDDDVANIGAADLDHNLSKWLRDRP